jgi:hypothetical protein
MKIENDNSFEKGFREAFDKASLAPPDVIWENIEKALPSPTGPSLKPDAQTITTSTKLLVGAGIAVLSGLIYLYLGDSSTINYNSILNTSKNEKTFTPAPEPTKLVAKPESPAVAFDAPIVTQKQVVLSLKPTNIALEQVEHKAIEPLPNVEEFIPSKIEDKFSEIMPKALKMSKIIMETPDLVPNTDSQNLYYDPNAIQTVPKIKGQFWQNFKIRGGIRVSN